MNNPIDRRILDTPASILKVERRQADMELWRTAALISVPEMLMLCVEHAGECCCCSQEVGQEALSASYPYPTITQP